MHTSLKTVVAFALLAIGSLAAAATDPAIGTWKLNLDKSTFSPGPPPKAQTRSYGDSAQGITLTVTTTDASGKESTTTLTFKQDGKPYPASGNPNFDSVSVKRVNGRSAHSTQYKSGVIVGTGVRTVSKDGKTLTYANKGSESTGAKFSDVSVYDRQ